MKLSLLCCAAVLASLSAVACSGSTADVPAAEGDQDLTSALGTGTYLVDSKPFFDYYASRITLLAGKKFEAEIVSSRGDTTLLAGSYDILPARANNPQSPVKSDKPTLYLTSDSGAAPQAFEFDRLPDGSLKLYHSARSASFTMKKDPSWKPAPTDGKSITCTGPTVNAAITIDQAQGRRGTLKLTRKAGADRHDPPSVSVPITQTEGGGVPEYIYFEGSKGEQDFYVNMIKKDFERGSGDVKLFLRWAEGGQEFSIGANCAFK
jgi:hypothetical protein